MRTRQLTMTAMMTALMCLIGPLTLPVGPIPLSLTTAVLMLCAMLLGPKQACMGCAAYLLLGLAGLPVLSGFTGGAGRLLGPTGGFLLGYLPLTALCGVVCNLTDRRIWHALGMTAAACSLYAVGTIWYCVQAHTSLHAALAICVIPFLPMDALKIITVLLLGPVLKRRLKKAGLLR